MLPPALAPLAAWPQFIAWRIEARDGRLTKVPYSPIHGGMASSTEPRDWGTYEQAQALADTLGYNGVGFVLTERDPFWFLDIDGALQDGPPAAWSVLAQELCARLPGAAVEISQSGRGLHVIGSTSVPLAPLHGNRNTPLKLEFYSRWRFVALTGIGAQGSVSTVLDAPLAAVIEQYFPRAAGETSAEWTVAPDPEWNGPADDDELIALIRASDARKAAAVFGGENGNPTFTDLYTLNYDILVKKWPSGSSIGDGVDHSSADQAMANLLAFWTGRDCGRIERIMRSSALVRDKWDSHNSYLSVTILKARALITSVYQAARSTPPPPPKEEIEAAGYEPREAGGGIMLAHTQLEYFAGCVYVSAINKVLTPRGEQLDQARFDVHYSGYEFVVSNDGRKTTDSAWAAFTRNQAYKTPIADRLCFRPEIGSGGIVNTGSIKLANFYVAIETERTVGDPSKYLDLLRRQLPVERDRDILLHYMASVVQHPGLKAQWWPVLQSMEGTAKTAHLEAMVHAIGEQYCHLPNTNKMIRQGMNFNGWIDGRLFIGLEEVFAAERRDFFESFKTTVTNRRLPIEGKGVEEATRDNRANGMIATNHKEGVPIERRNRRYSIFFMAQQNDGDLERDGMTPAYFSDFYDWFYGRETYGHLGVNYGLRVINHYLRTYPLDKPEFDPARLATRAPATSSMEEALASGRGRAEQEIIEAVEEERPGFAGGWISSIKLDQLLKACRLDGAIPHNKRRDVLQSLGYVYHPALGTEGRVNNVIDGGKPRLFVKKSSIQALNIHTAAEATRAFVEAQRKAESDRSAAGQVFGGGK